MEIVLKQKWDAQVSAPFYNSTPVEDDSLFIGRKMELDLLKNEILQKEQGSILVAGHRGVGKTSFVYKALQGVQEALRVENNAQSLFIYINAGQLDNNGTGEAGEINTETILKTLVRRLYATARDLFGADDARGRRVALERLYKKAVAREFRLEEQVLNTQTKADSGERKTEQKLTFDRLKPVAFLPLFSLAAGAGAFALMPSGTGVGIKLLLAILMILPVAFSYSIQNKSVSSSEQKNQVRAEELYQLDNNLGNLEYDLEEFHRLLHADGIKIIYVIDELDKLTSQQEGKVLRYLKNLFTLSKAIFLFIGNEDLYQRACYEGAGVGEDHHYRSEYYTFFNSKYFISRPTIDELKQFFLTRVDESVDKDNAPMERVIHYLAFESKADYFNLVNTLRDSIVKYEGGRPVIEIGINNPVVVKKSRLHKSVSVVFYQMYYLENFSRRRDNEKTYRHLINYMYALKESHANATWPDPEEGDWTSSAVRDVNRVLAGLNFLKRDSERIVRINGLDTPVSTYVYSGLFNADPPEYVEIMSEKEKRFLKEATSYMQAVLPMINMGRMAGGERMIDAAFLQDHLTSLLAVELAGVELTPTLKWCDIFYDLRLRVPVRDYGLEALETATDELSDAISRLNGSMLPVFRAHVTRWYYKNGYYTDSANPLMLHFSEILRNYQIDWNEFYHFQKVGANEADEVILFGPHKPMLVNALQTIEGKDKKDFEEHVLFTILFYAPGDPGQYVYITSSSLHKFRYRMLGVDSPENMLLSFERIMAQTGNEDKGMSTPAPVAERPEPGNGNDVAPMQPVPVREQKE